ncbi:hypothetical protein HK099_006212 [Clydaea vesicula]|uniref:CRAL-TRIO domain-containing protein n=1 Tax=Clydaea vesicula TaxID=447962 RepID=A0AAD5TXV3_9FUNG|nr:hypothetical protein HK099_006212 [Clydaea vesicula]
MLVRLTPEIYLKTGLFVRSLTDKSLSVIPGLKHIVEYGGGVEATVNNCKTLMNDGQPILVYPGGASEMFKDERNQKYELKWFKRKGFAKLAIESGYSIVPFSSVGKEDLVYVPFSISSSWFWYLMGDAERAKKNFYYSKNSTRFPVIFFNIKNYLLGYNKMIVSFGEPIDMKEYSGCNEEGVWELRERVRENVEFLIQDGISYRNNLIGLKAKKNVFSPSKVYAESVSSVITLNSQQQDETLDETTSIVAEEIAEDTTATNILDETKVSTVIPETRKEVSTFSIKEMEFIQLARSELKNINTIKIFSDLQIVKFYIGHKYQSEVALRELGQTLLWWELYGTAEVVNEDFFDLYSTKKLYHAGFAKDGTPIVIFKSSNHIQGDYPRNVRFIVWFVEKMRERGLSDKVTLIVDRFDMTAKNTDDNILPQIAAVFQPHYPETLGRLFVAPKSFVLSVIWPVVKLFLDPVTASKVNMLSEKNYQEKLKEFIDEDQLLERYGGKLKDPTESEEYLEFLQKPYLESNIILENTEVNTVQVKEIQIVKTENESLEISEEDSLKHSKIENANKLLEEIKDKSFVNANSFLQVPGLEKSNLKKKLSFSISDIEINYDTHRNALDYEDRTVAKEITVVKKKKRLSIFNLKAFKKKP